MALRLRYRRRRAAVRANHVRWFDPTVGRWLTEDPAAADENQYRYCENAPENATDPSGMIIEYNGSFWWDTERPGWIASGKPPASDDSCHYPRSRTIALRTMSTVSRNRACFN